MNLQVGMVELGIHPFLTCRLRPTVIPLRLYSVRATGASGRTEWRERGTGVVLLANRKLCTAHNTATRTRPQGTKEWAIAVTQLVWPNPMSFIGR